MTRRDNRLQEYKALQLESMTPDRLGPANLARDFRADQHEDFKDPGMNSRLARARVLKVCENQYPDIYMQYRSSMS